MSDTPQNLNEQQASYAASLGASYRDKLNQANLGYDVIAAGGSLELNEGGGALAAVGQAAASLTGQGSGIKTLSIKQGNINDYAGSQVLINSDRIILNTRTDYLMLFGGAGVNISSKSDIKIDTDASITLFGDDNLYLGIPNKGAAIPKQSAPNAAVNGASVVQTGPTLDVEYEPLVLGEKLADIIEDLLDTLITSTHLNPVGTGHFREDTIYNLNVLKARLPEMLSEYAFVDGYTHRPAGVFPTAPSSLATTGGQLDPNASLVRGLIGQAGSGTSALLAQNAITSQPTDPLASLPGYFEATILYEDPL